MVSSSVIYALLSLICAGGNDVVFKRYAAKNCSRGAYVFGIGLVWAVLQLAYASQKGFEFGFTGAPMFYGLACRYWRPDKSN
jgi:hypothetical protein